MDLLRPLLLTLLLMTGAAAQPAAAPQGGQHDRRVAVFDFEERARGNVESIPMHWRKVAGPGLPHYVSGQLATDLAATGRYSFRMQLNGGSLIYRLDPGTLAVREGAHYKATVHVRSKDLRSSRVRFSAFLADDAGLPLPETTVRATPITANDGWQTMEVSFTADEPHATSIVLELGLVQPELWSAADLGDRTLYTPDINGTAWFDDLTVEEIPRVAARFDRPAGVYQPDQVATLRAEVNDRYASDLTPAVRVLDEAGQVVMAEQTLPFHPGDSSLGFASHASLHMAVPPLPPGWYQAELTFRAGSEAILVQRVPFVRLANDATANPHASNTTKADRRVTLDASHLPAPAWPELPEVLTTLGSGRVKLTVWPDASAAATTTELPPLDRVVARLRDSNIRVTAALLQPPPGLVSAQSRWADLTAANAGQWAPSLSYLLARHANHIDTWEMGSSATAHGNAADPGFHRALDAMVDKFETLAGASALAVLWPTTRDAARLPQGVRVRLLLGPQVRAQTLPLFINPAAPQDVELLPLPPEAFGSDEARADLARRVLTALSCEVRSLTLPLPVQVQPNAAGGSPALAPTPLLPTVHTLLTTMAGSRFVAALPAEPGTTALLFQREGDGVIALWSDGRTASPAPFALTVATGSRTIDVMGRSTSARTAAPNPSSALQTIALTPTPSPQLITGVDVPLSSIAATARFDEPFMEADFKPQTRHLLLTNNTLRPQSITCRFRSPDGWVLSIENPRLVLQPQQTASLPVTIRFPYNADAGLVPLTLELHTEELDTPLSLPIALHLGLTDANTQVIAWREGNDTLIRQTVTNTTSLPITYIAFAVIPGHARQERLVQDLPPAASTVKTYRFPSAQAPTCRIGLRQIDGTRVLNHTIDLGPP